MGEKRHWYMQQKESFFESFEAKRVLRDKEGARVLQHYQMLVLKSMNTDYALINPNTGKPYNEHDLMTLTGSRTLSVIRHTLEVLKSAGLLFETDSKYTLALPESMYADSRAIQADSKARTEKRHAQQSQAAQALAASDNGQMSDNCPTTIPIPEQITNNNSTTTTDTNTQTKPNSGGGGVSPEELDELEKFAESFMDGVNKSVLNEIHNYATLIGTELVHYAINEACEQGKPTFVYAKAIIQRLQREGIKTVAEAKASDAKHAAERKQRQISRPNDPTGEYARMLRIQV